MGKVKAQPLCRLRMHKSGEFKVLISRETDSWFFTNKKMQELPLGSIDASIGLKDRSSYGKPPIAYIDENPTTELSRSVLLCGPGLHEVNIREVAFFKEHTKCIFNNRLVHPNYYYWQFINFNTSGDKCKLCGERLMESTNPYYTRTRDKLNLDHINYPIHVKQGELKKNVVVIKTKEINYGVSTPITGGYEYPVIAEGKSSILRVGVNLVKITWDGKNLKYENPYPDCIIVNEADVHDDLVEYFKFEKKER
jgi:hypothetical protein